MTEPEVKRLAIGESRQYDEKGEPKRGWRPGKTRNGKRTRVRSLPQRFGRGFFPDPDYVRTERE